MSAIAWLPEALEDMKRLHKFLRDKEPRAAERAMEAIDVAVSLLESSPRLGRPLQDERKMRDLIVGFGAAGYVVRYRFDEGDSPVIVRVWHDRENRQH